jgi:hypothetical protein
MAVAVRGTLVAGRADVATDGRALVGAGSDVVVVALEDDEL